MYRAPCRDSAATSHLCQKVCGLIQCIDSCFCLVSLRAICLSVGAAGAAIDGIKQTSSTPIGFPGAEGHTEWVLISRGNDGKSTRINLPKLSYAERAELTETLETASKHLFPRNISSSNDRGNLLLPRAITCTGNHGCNGHGSRTLDGWRLAAQYWTPSICTDFARAVGEFARTANTYSQSAPTEATLGVVGGQYNINTFVVAWKVPTWNTYNPCLFPHNDQLYKAIDVFTTGAYAYCTQAQAGVSYNSASGLYWQGPYDQQTKKLYGVTLIARFELTPVPNNLLVTACQSDPLGLPQSIDSSGLYFG